MSASQELQRRLEKLRASERSHSDDSSALRKKWVSDLVVLMRDIGAWLSPLEKKGLLRVANKPIILEETGLGGAYETVGLQIQGPAGRLVEIRPVARFVVAANGRVDIESGLRRAVLVRRKWDRPGELPGDILADYESTWWITALPPSVSQPTYEELNRDSFSKVLRDLLS